VFKILHRCISGSIAAEERGRENERQNSSTQEAPKMAQRLCGYGFVSGKCEKAHRDECGIEWKQDRGEAETDSESHLSRVGLRLSRADWEALSCADLFEVDGHVKV
jgi:hypothetical protein